MHGLVRLPHLGAFAEGMVKLFRETLLPAIIVRSFALSLVFVEATVGLLILLGLWMRWALLVALMVAASYSARHCNPTGTRWPFRCFIRWFTLG
jgi:thiosulfate dehydrogenase (quinone) large subunit